MKKIITISLVLLLVSGVTIYMLFSPKAMVEKYVYDNLQKRALELDFDIARVALKELLIRNIRSKAGDAINIDNISVSYNIGDFLGGKVSSVNIKGIKLKPSGFDIKALKSLLKGGSASGRTFPFDKLIITDSFIEVDLKGVSILIPFAAEFDVKGDSLEGVADIRGAVLKFSDYFISFIGNVSANGVINGRIPIKYTDGFIHVEGGWLESASGGSIEIEIASDSPLANNQDQKVRMLMNSLKDYKYNKFRITFSNNKEGKLFSTVSIDGSNKEVYGDRPVKLNINYTSNILEFLNEQ